MGYLPDAFHAHFAHDRAGDDVFGDVEIRYTVEDEPLGTAGAIRFAAEGIDERFVVCNGDVLTDLDLGAMVRFHDERDARGDDLAHAGRGPERVRCRADPRRRSGDRVRREAAAGQGAEQLDQRGHLRARAAFLDRIPPRLNVSIERETFPRMLAEPRRALRLRRATGTGSTSGRRRSTCRPTPTCSADASAGRRRPARARSAPGVWIQGHGAHRRRARSRRPGAARRRRRIDAGAAVSASVIGPGAVVEAGAAVERSVLHAASASAPTATSLDSVVGADARLEPDVSLRDQTIVGAGVTVPTASRITAGRVPTGAPRVQRDRCG